MVGYAVAFSIRDHVAIAEYESFVDGDAVCVAVAVNDNFAVIVAEPLTSSNTIYERLTVADFDLDAICIFDAIFLFVDHQYAKRVRLTEWRLYSYWNSEYHAFSDPYCIPIRDADHKRFWDIVVEPVATVNAQRNAESDGLCEPVCVWELVTVAFNFVHPDSKR